AGAPPASRDAGGDGIPPHGRGGLRRVALLRELGDDVLDHGKSSLIRRNSESPENQTERGQPRRRGRVRENFDERLLAGSPTRQSVWKLAHQTNRLVPDSP